MGRKTLLIVLAQCWVGIAIAGQVESDMNFKEIVSDDASDKIKDGNSLMVIKSEIPNLMFESSKGIFSNSVTEIESGIWWVILKPGVQMISISAKGFNTISDIRHNFIDTQVWTIQVSTGEQNNYGYGKFTLTTTPAGCTVYLNNTRLKSKTPLPLTEIAIGNYILRIEKANYSSVERTISITNKILNEFSYSLRKIILFAGIEITSEPSGATVEIDNKPLGQTPFKNSGLKPRKHSVTLEHVGYQSVNENIELTNGKWNKIHYNLKKIIQPVAISKMNILIVTAIITLSVIVISTIFIKSSR